MAPEQIPTVTHEGSRAADIYAAGIAAIEILTAASPFDVNRDDDPISLKSKNSSEIIFEQEQNMDTMSSLNSCVC
jgi:hypothetical protein